VGPHPLRRGRLLGGAAPASILSASPSPTLSHGRQATWRIGELRDLGTIWRLRYTTCGHVQEIAREGLEEPAQAEREVRRHFARCLTCRVAPAS
jgi:hypothetical protein